MQAQQSRKSAQPEQCAHGSCSCPVTAAEGVSARGKRYCSEGCMNGKGCEHESCNCSEGERSP
jgi:hypothetical protein